MTTAIQTRTIGVHVLANTYRDSVELMRVAADLERVPGVQRAGLVMGTPANRAILEEAGLLIADADAAGPNDLVVSVMGESAAVQEALASARAALAGARSATPTASTHQPPPHSVAEAVIEEPSARLALISTPGAYATAEAMKALKRGLHVFLFSDNVSVQDELELKTLARRKQRLVMGPDCGTAILDGLPIGFANAIRPGRVGIVAASGTGLQQVACLVDRWGEGISQAIGVGGRDLDVRVGGVMMLDSIERLAMDPETHVLVLLSKPPAPEVAQRVLDAARVSGKRVVVNFLGERELLREGNGVRVPTLEAAAAWAVAFARDEAEATEIVLAPQLLGEAARIAERFADTQARVEGLYSGGTLAKEAALVLEWSGIAHEVLDLGDDEFTVGRPHPMIDMRLRTERILSTSEDPRVAVLLLDVVLGYGSHADPASELGPAIERTRARAAQAGRTLAVVASICGTERDPQGFDRQAAELSAAGVLLAPSNAQAARLATAMIRAPRVADARA